MGESESEWEKGRQRVRCDVVNQLIVHLSSFCPSLPSFSLSITFSPSFVILVFSSLSPLSLSFLLILLSLSILFLFSLNLSACIFLTLPLTRSLLERICVLLTSGSIVCTAKNCSDERRGKEKHWKKPVCHLREREREREEKEEERRRWKRKRRMKERNEWKERKNTKI